MAKNQESIDWLYKQFSSRPEYNVGKTQADFENALSREDARKWLYDEANKLGYNVGTREQFDDLMGYGAPAQPAIQSQPAQNPSVKANPAPTNEKEYQQQLNNQQDYSQWTDDQLDVEEQSILQRGRQNKEKNITYQQQWEKEHPFLANLKQAMNADRAIYDTQQDESDESGVIGADSKALSQIRAEKGKRAAANGFDTQIAEAQAGRERSDRMMKKVPTGGEFRNYASAKYLYDKADEILNAPSKYDGKEGVQGFGQGLANFNKGLGENLFDRQFFALADLQRNVHVGDLVEKLNSGAELNDSESELINAYITLSEAQQARSNDLSLGYEIGEGAAKSAPFMVDMFVTHGLAAAGKKALLRNIERRLGKEVAVKYAKWLGGAKGVNIGTHTSPNVIGATNNIGKQEVGRYIAREAVETPLQTIAMPSSWAGVYNDKVNSMLQSGKTDWDTKELIRSLGNMYVETLTERAGGKMIDLGLGKVGKLAGVTFDKVPGIRVLKRAYSHKAGSTSIPNDFIQTPPGETFEEYLGAGINYLRSFNPMYSDESNAQLRAEAQEMFTPEGFAKTFGTVLPMSLLGGAVNLSKSWIAANQYTNARQRLHDMLVAKGATQEQADNIMSTMEGAKDNQEFDDYAYNMLSNLAALGFEPFVVSDAVTQYARSYYGYNLSVAELNQQFQELTPEQQAQAKREMAESLASINANAEQVQEQPAKQETIPETLYDERRVSAEQAADEELQGRVAPDGNIYQVQLYTDGEETNRVGYIVDWIGEGEPKIFTNKDDVDSFDPTVTPKGAVVRFDDGTVQQVTLQDIHLISHNDAAVERLALTNANQTKETFHVGDEVNIVDGENAGSSAIVRDVQEDGSVVVDVQLPNGTVDQVPIPAEVALTSLVTSADMNAEPVQGQQQSDVVQFKDEEGNIHNYQRTDDGYIALREDGTPATTYVLTDEDIQRRGLTPVEQTQEPAPEPEPQVPAYPTDEQGNPDFAQMDATQGAQVLVDYLDGDKASAIAWANGQLESAKRTQTQANKAKATANGSLAQYKQQLATINSDKQAAAENVAKWQEIVNALQNEPATPAEPAATVETPAPAASVEIQKEEPNDNEESISKKEVYHRHATENQSAKTDEESQSVEQSGTQSNSSMNTPTTLSADKGTTNNADLQVPEQKSDENTPENSNLQSGGVQNEEQKQTEEVNPNRRGHKQLVKYTRELREAIDAFSKDHSDNNAFAIDDAICGLDNNISAGAEATKEELQLLEEAKKVLADNGYELFKEVGGRYNEGDRVEADFYLDDSLPTGNNRIKKLIRHQINKNGVMVRSAKLVVSQPLFRDKEEEQEFVNNITNVPDEQLQYVLNVNCSQFVKDAALTEIERRKQPQEPEQAEVGKTLSDYVNTMSELQKGKVLEVLNKVFNYPDGTMTRAAFVEQALEKGRSLRTWFEKGNQLYGINTSDSKFVPITKTEYDYGVYLGLQAPSDEEVQKAKDEDRYNTLTSEYQFNSLDDIDKRITQLENWSKIANEQTTQGRELKKQLEETRELRDLRVKLNKDSQQQPEQHSESVAPKQEEPKQPEEVKNEEPTPQYDGNGHETTEYVFPKALAQQQVVPAKVKDADIDFEEVAESDPLRPVLNGVNYANGYKTATDGQVIVSIKADYPEENEGNIIITDKKRDMLNKALHTNTYKNVIEGKYPSIGWVIKGETENATKTPFNPRKLREFIAGAEKLLRQDAKEGGTKLNDAISRIKVYLRDSKGNVISVRIKNLKKFTEAAEQIGATEILTGGERNALVAQTEKGFVLCMPLLQENLAELYMLEGKDYVKDHKTAWDEGGDERRFVYDLNDTGQNTDKQSEPIDLQAEAKKKLDTVRKLQEERRQRIIDEGTTYDTPFELIKAFDIATSPDGDAVKYIIKNIDSIIKKLKWNNGEFDKFEGYAGNKGLGYNAARQIFEYLTMLKGVATDYALRRVLSNYKLYGKSADEFISYFSKLYDDLKLPEGDRNNPLSESSRPEGLNNEQYLGLESINNTSIAAIKYTHDTIGAIEYRDHTPITGKTYNAGPSVSVHVQPQVGEEQIYTIYGDVDKITEWINAVRKAKEQQALEKQNDDAQKQQLVKKELTPKKPEPKQRIETSASKTDGTYKVPSMKSINDESRSIFEKIKNGERITKEESDILRSKGDIPTSDEVQTLYSVGMNSYVVSRIFNGLDLSVDDRDNIKYLNPKAYAALKHIAEKYPYIANVKTVKDELETRENASENFMNALKFLLYYNNDEKRPDLNKAKDAFRKLTKSERKLLSTRYPDSWCVFSDLHKDEADEHYAKHNYQSLEDADVAVQRVNAKHTKVKIDDFAANKNDVREALTGVYHDGEYAVATDTHILAAFKDEYQNEHKGKVVKDGREIPTKYPNWKTVIPNNANIVTKVNTEDFRKYLAGVEAILKDELDYYNEAFSIKKIRKDAGINGARIAIKMSDGSLVYMNIDYLKRFVDTMDKLGTNEILTQDNQKAIVAKSDKGLVLLMPMLSNHSESGLLDYINNTPIEVDNETPFFFYNPQAHLNGSPAQKPKVEQPQEKKGEPIITETSETAKKEVKQEPKQEQQKTTKVSKSTATETDKPTNKLDDFGEKILGARKDMLKETAQAIENASVQTLIAEPYAKAFKKPNVERLVKSGVIREQDAIYVEAMLQGTLNTQKPRLKEREKWYARRGGKTSVEKWAERTYDKIQELGKFISASEEERDAMIENWSKPSFPNAEIEKRTRDYLSSDSKHLLTPDETYVMAEVLKRIGYTPGKKYDIPNVRITTYGDNYKIFAGDKNAYYPTLGTHETLEDAIKALTIGVQLLNGETNIEIPEYMFRYKGTKQVLEETGKWEVYYYKGGFKIHKFDTEEKADEYLATLKEKRIDADKGKEYNRDKMTDWVIRFTNPFSGDEFQHTDKYATREEAENALHERYDELNEYFVTKNAEKMGREVDGNKSLVSVQYVSGRDGHGYAVVYVNKNAIGNGIEVYSPFFKTSKEAYDYLAKNKESIENEIKSWRDVFKKFVYFNPNKNRVGEDYRHGKDATPEQFTEQFGFRGVQFGNWTNAEDRQKALNETYDAFMDLAKITGLPTRALSLNGELGIAFGARGTGSALAHYEMENVVINLTKTKGAGSLAHEWLHAIDNYFARQSDLPVSFVTSVRDTPKMRPEMRDAWNNFVDEMNRLPFAKRSKGSYWGSEWEKAARLFGEWVVYEQAKKGEVNSFLSRGIDADRFEKYRDSKYQAYLYRYNLNPKIDNVTGKPLPPMSREEYYRLPESLGDFPYPEKSEVDVSDSSIRRLFDTMKTEEDAEMGNVRVYSAGDNQGVEKYANGLTDAQQLATDVVVMALENLGLKPNVISNEEADAIVIDNYGSKYYITNENENKKGELERNIDERIAELNRQNDNESLKSNLVGNSADSQDNTLGSPDLTGTQSARLSNLSAKVRNKIGTSKYFAKKTANFILKLQNSNDTVIENYAKDFVSALGQTAHNQPTEYVRYINDNGEIVSVRIGDHSGNSRNILLRTVRSDKGYSIVVIEGEENKAKFKSSKWANVKEYVYKNVDKDRLISITKSLFNLFDTGEYVDLADYDEYNKSPKSIDRLFKTYFNTVYGFTKDGKIILAERGLNPNTPIHEYTHLWAEAIRQKNPALWQNIKDLFANNPLVEIVKRDVNYKDLDEDSIIDEVLARYSGSKGAERLESEAQKMIDEDNTVLGRARIRTFLKRVKEALDKFWEWVGKNLFKIERFGSQEEVADRVLYDLFNKTNLETGETNGSPTQKRKLEIDYIKAAKDGDEALCAEIVKQYAKLAMPDTKVANAYGEPLVVYHGTDEQFTIFDQTKGRANMDIQGMFFSPYRLDAQGYGKNVNEFYLNIKNPAKEHVAYNLLNKHISENGAGVKARNELITLGYDGVTSMDEEFIALYPEQIKSAKPITYDDNGEIIPLEKRFDFSNNDTRFQIAPDNYLQDDGTEEWQLATETAMQLLHDAGIDADVVSNEEADKVANNSAYQLVRADNDNYESEMEAVNDKFNKQLNDSSIETISDEVFYLGTPSDILLAAGIEDKPIRLYGATIAKKYRKHNFALNDLINLPKAIADPIAIFKTKEEGYVILSELITDSGNIVITISLGKGNDATFDIIDSIYHKNESGVVAWIEDGKMVAVNKEKALNYLRTVAPLATTTNNRGLLIDAAKVVNNFDTSKSFGEKMQNSPENSQIAFQRVTNDALLDKLNSEPTIKKLYRSMQVFPDRPNEYFSPMATVINGEMQGQRKGVWYESDEHPELVIPNVDKNGTQKVYDKKADNAGQPNYKFRLNKGESQVEGKVMTKVNAAYNPYFHSSPTMLNDQFAQAVDRPNLITVEVEVPESELKGEYNAPFAKDHTGMHEWKAGPVQSKLSGTRPVMLSKYCRIIREVPNDEVARSIAKQLKGHDIAIPFNVLPPALRIELEKLGVKISDKDTREGVMKRGIELQEVSNGHVYGWTRNGKITLAERGINPNTPIHEYSHLWCQAVRKKNPVLWESVKKNFAPLLEMVKNDRNYRDLQGDVDRMTEEAVAQFSGKRGAQRLEDMAREELQDNPSLETAARIRNIINRVKKALSELWSWIGKNLFHLKKFNSPEEVADRIMYDLMIGTDLNADIEEHSGNDIRFQIAPAPYAGESMQDYAARTKVWYETQRIPQAVDEYDEHVQKEADRLGKKAYRRVLDYASPIENFIKWSKERGAKVDSDNNAYKDVFLASGRKTSATNDYLRNHRSKLIDAIRSIIADKSLDNVDIRWQNLDEKRVPKKERRNGTQLTPVEIMGVYAQARDCKEAAEMGLADRGAQGFVNNLGMTYDDVITAVESAIGQDKVNAFWDAVRDNTHFALKYQLKGGLINQDTYDKYANQRQYYVPQRGWRERDMDGQSTSYLESAGTYNSPYNAALKRAKGRTSLASDPFAYIESIAESAITSTENNKTKQKLLQFVMDNEELGLQTGAFHFERFYIRRVMDADGNPMYEIDGTPKVEVTYQKPTADEIAHDKAIEKQIDKLQKEIAKYKKALKSAISPDVEDAINNAIYERENKIADLEEHMYIAKGVNLDKIQHRTNDELAQHVVNVVKDGETYAIFLRDEKLAQAVNREFEKEERKKREQNESKTALAKLLHLGDLAKTGTRYMSATLTQYNPEFAARNFARDYQAAIVTLMAENPKLVVPFTKHFALAQQAVWTYVMGDKLQDKDLFTNDKYGDYLQEYYKSGAQTGYSYLQDLQLTRKNFNKAIESGNGKRAWDIALGTLSALTEWSETSVRFAGYVAARESGMSIDDAAYLSKELTTNFDRRGENAHGLPAHFSFLRATLNGNLKYLKAFKYYPIQYSAVAAAFFILGLVNHLLNPNDPEDEVYIGDYSRQSNFTFGKYKVPATHFFRMFFSTGTNLAMYLNGDKTAAKAAYDAALFTADEMLPNYMNVANLWDYNDRTGKPELDVYNYLQAAAPTSISPIFDVMINRDFMGSPINGERYEAYYNIDKNDKDKYKKNTAKGYVDAVNYVYETLGGNPNTEYKTHDSWLASKANVSPSNVQHIVEGYSPQVADLVAATANIIQKGINGEEVYASDIPFVRSFYSSYKPDRVLAAEYWKLKPQIDVFNENLADYKKTDRPTYNKVVNSEQYRLYKRISNFMDDLDPDKPATQRDIQKLMEYNREWNKARNNEKF